jgi:hypothetical protein
MAYTKDLTTVCQYGGCTSKAVLEVFNRFNASLGKYCRKHGTRKCLDQEKSERGGR